MSGPPETETGGTANITTSAREPRRRRARPQERQRARARRESTGRAVPARSRALERDGRSTRENRSCVAARSDARGANYRSDSRRGAPVRRSVSSTASGKTVFTRYRPPSVSPSRGMKSSSESAVISAVLTTPAGVSRSAMPTSCSAGSPGPAAAGSGRFGSVPGGCRVAMVVLGAKAKGLRAGLRGPAPVPCVRAGGRPVPGPRLPSPASQTPRPGVPAARATGTSPPPRRPPPARRPAPTRGRHTPSRVWESWQNAVMVPAAPDLVLRGRQLREVIVATRAPVTAGRARIP